MISRVVLLIVSAAALTAAVFSQDAQPSPAPEAKPAEKANARPLEPERKPEPWDKADVEAMAAQCVTFDTAKGSIVMEMYPESAPEAVRNFLNLAATGALDTTKFDRVVPGFVIQGGNLYTSENLTSELRWRAIRTIRDEPNQIIHEKGIVSMARPDEPDSATTSFFILLKAASNLDGKFAAFGKVVSGYEVVEAINGAEVDGEKPKEPVRINKASVAPCGSN